MLEDTITIENLDQKNVNYDRALKKLLDPYPQGRFLYQMGDIDYHIDRYAFVKNRNQNESKTVILRSLNHSRHWKLYYDPPTDLHFNKKIDKIFWRGTTTGKPTNTGNRFNLITKWFQKHPDIDLGFSFISQNKSEYKKYVKGEVKPEYFLKYKYILSVEGNDKDSGLNWKLNSNSIVLMPRPTKTSWLMETTLIPNYHYVELENDFSDLLDKLKWCRANQDQCREIIKNAHNFMSQFSDQRREQEIENRVVSLYFQKTTQKSHYLFIIPYRNREKHLSYFIQNTYPSLKKIIGEGFHILVVEQETGKGFNRGKILNVGFHYLKNCKNPEIKNKFFANTHIFTHDVDINPRPETIKNIYQKSLKDNEIMGIYTSSCDTLGGIIKFTPNVYEKINGFTNNIWVWGSEDKDIQNRLYITILLLLRIF